MINDQWEFQELRGSRGQVAVYCRHFCSFGCRFCGHPTIMKGTPKVTGIKDITSKIWNRYKTLVSSHFRYLPVFAKDP